MTKLLLPLFAFAALSLSSASQAAELSPWMGGEGQAPFQLDPVTMVAVTFAADPLQTGSTSKRGCSGETCAFLPLAANTPLTNP